MILPAYRSEREGMRRRVTDASAFSEVTKSEVRMWLRGLSENERRQIHMTTRDPLLIESIATMPHYLSGIKEDDWEKFVSRIIEDQKHARLGILLVEEGILRGSGERAIAVAEADIKREIEPMRVAS